jgi:hypothetical protein
MGYLGKSRCASKSRCTCPCTMRPGRPNSTSRQSQDVKPTAGKVRTSSMSSEKMYKALYACSGTGMQCSGSAHHSGKPLLHRPSLGSRVRSCDYAAVIASRHPPLAAVLIKRWCIAMPDDSACLHGPAIFFPAGRTDQYPVQPSPISSRWTPCRLLPRCCTVGATPQLNLAGRDTGDKQEGLCNRNTRCWPAGQRPPHNVQS